jgi:DNA-binding MarR family transcriptional regulator
MSESNELYASVNYIKHKVEAIERIELLNLRSNEKLLEEYLKKLKSDGLLLKVYKKIDGEKTQKIIAGELGTTEMTISNKIKELRDIGLIEIIDAHGRQRIYKHSVAEKAFKLIDKIDKKIK